MFKYLGTESLSVNSKFSYSVPYFYRSKKKSSNKIFAVFRWYLHYAKFQYDTVCSTELTYKYSVVTICVISKLNRNHVCMTGLFSYDVRWDIFKVSTYTLG